MLLLHINFTMFIPQVDEMDIYDRSGRQIEDVNSLSEYLVEAFTPTEKHYSKKDGDDDNARYFQLYRTTLFLEQPVAVVQMLPARCRNKSIPLTDETRLAAGFSKVVSPPPKA